jgi:hypothetical protein
MELMTARMPDESERRTFPAENLAAINLIRRPIFLQRCADLEVQRVD